MILANEFDQRVASIFLPFDNYGNKTVSITDLPLIVRGLGNVSKIIIRTIKKILSEIYILC